MSFIQITPPNANGSVTFFLVINVNYELFLNDELMKSSASLVTPFEFGSNNAFTLALWVQYAVPNDKGTFLTLFQVS